MKKLFLLAALTFMATAVFVSCKKTEADPEPTDLDVTDADFANFASWQLITKTTGTAANIGGAHLNTNAAVTRYIYTKTGKARKANGQYPIGTIVIKEYRNADGTVFNSAPNAMVKRKAGYNTDNNDWEFVRIDRATGAIAKDAAGNPSRGTALATSCGGCHKAGIAKDFVFTGQ